MTQTTSTTAEHYETVEPVEVERIQNKHSWITKPIFQATEIFREMSFFDVDGSILIFGDGFQPPQYLLAICNPEATLIQSCPAVKQTTLDAPQRFHTRRRHTLDNFFVTPRTLRSYYVFSVA